MSLLTHDQVGLLTKAVAKAVGAILEIYDRADLGVQTKGDNSPITLADKAAHKILMAELATITPDIPVVSEESAEHPKFDPDGAFWLVDPLDGTKEFISRNGQFTVNIGLIHERQPAFGIVAAPTMNRVWVGNVKARHAYIIDENGTHQDIKTRSLPTEGYTVVGSKSHAHEREEALMADKTVANKAAVGSSLKFCIIAEGAADIYPRAGRTMEWDTAAGHAVLAAAGGRVAHWDESAFSYAKQSDFANDHGFIAHAR